MLAMSTPSAAPALTRINTASRKAMIDGHKRHKQHSSPDDEQPKHHSASAAAVRSSALPGRSFRTYQADAGAWTALAVSVVAILLGLVLTAQEHKSTFVAPQDSKSDLPPARGCLSVFRFWTYTPEQKRNASVAAGVLLSAVGLIVFGVALSLVSQTVGDGPSTPLVWTWQIAVCSIIVFFVGGLYASAGMSGGGFYSACFIAIMGLPTHEGLPLGYLAGFGIAVGSVAFLIQSRHLLADRPLIDFLMCLVLEPFTMLGSIFGVWLNLMFPGVILAIFLVLVLGVSSWRSFVKARQWRQQEQAAAEAEANKRANDSSNSERLLQPEESESLHSKEVQEVLAEESKFPWKYVLALFALWVVLSTLVLLRGGDAAHVSIIGVSCGSTVFIILLCVTFAFLIACTALIGWWAYRNHKNKVSIGYPFLPTDTHWTMRQLLLWPLFSIFIGAAAGFVGISGGLIQGPFLLEMGVIPQVTAAVTSFLILFTSSFISVQFFVYDLLDWRLGLWFFAVGLVCTFIAQTLLGAQRDS